MMKSKETPAVQWHDYPQEEPTKDGYYRINGLFGIREEKKPMQTITTTSQEACDFSRREECIRHRLRHVFSNFGA